MFRGCAKLMAFGWQRMFSWFTRPDSPRPLAWFRITLALFCLFKLWLVRESLLDMYGQYGFVQWAITRANLYEILPHLGNMALWLQPLGFSPDGTVYLFVGIYVLALVGLLAGMFTRWMAGLAFCIDFLLMNAAGGMIYGMDFFTHIALFYCVFMPSGDCLSLDAWRGRRKCAASVSAGVTRRVLQLHLAIVYLSSGLEKAAGAQWWNGEAIWRSVMLPIFHQFDMSWLAWHPWVAVGSGWSILATEIGYGFFIWCRKTRPVWLAAAITMHLFIGLFLGMWLFALIMIILNWAAFGPEALQDLRLLKSFKRVVHQ